MGHLGILFAQNSIYLAWPLLIGLSLSKLQIVYEPET